MKIKHLLLGTILAAIAGLAVSAGIGWQDHQTTEQASSDIACDTNRPLSAAVWKEVYSTPDELIAGVDTIVMAEVFSITPSRIAVSEGGKDELPFELVAFRVSDPIKGTKGEELIYVERAGGTDSKGKTVNIDFDGGRFEAGKSYLLFLKRQEEGPYFYQVNDQGRYDVIDDSLIPVGNGERDAVKDFFRNKPVGEGLRTVEEKLGVRSGQK